MSRWCRPSPVDFSKLLRPSGPPKRSRLPQPEYPKPVRLVATPDPVEHVGAESRKGLLAVVARRHGLTVDQLMDHRRTHWIVMARDEAFWLMRNQLGLSFNRIERDYHYDHTSIMLAVERHRRRLDALPQ